MKIRRKPAPRNRTIPAATKRLLNARHETAHAVTAWAQGMRVKRITLAPPLTRQECGTPLENARTCLAGVLQTAADFDALGLQRSPEHEREADHDTPAFEHWISAAGGWESTADLAERLTQETRNILTAHIPGRRALVDALFDRGTLDEAGVLGDLGAAPGCDA